MSGSLLVLVSDDPRLATTIATHLQKALDRSASVATLDTVHEHLGSNSLLVLASASAAETKQVLRLVQEVALHKGPPTILVLAGEETAPCQELACLESYVVQQLRWPQDASLLAGLVKERLGQSVCHGTGSRSLEDFVGQRLLRFTPSLFPMVDRIAMAGSHDMTVLLTGETGTGKTYLARLIHECSPRKGRRFLVVPCGGLAANLVGSELFGHAKGAFTGAEQRKIGKFAAAADGTLLLDEIDALGLDQQAKLLRVIETAEYEPVGSNETQRCNARIIAASNWNLAEAVQRGEFRRDLYYRLDVMPFHLPPLRERMHDIGPLARCLAARFNRKFQRDLFDIHPKAMQALEAFPWPGNIRQLENVLQEAVLVCRGPELLLTHLPRPVQEYVASGGPVPDNSLTHHRPATEGTLIQQALVRAGYKRARAARNLGISRVTLYKKMKKYGLTDVPLRAAQAQ
jgi:DNA-binding NtrC family response regulator